MRRFHKLLGVCLVITALGRFVTSPASAAPAVHFSEIMYHPVEEPAFNPDGTPVMELYHDVHEFVELHNAGTEPISLRGWRISGGIDYSFPRSARIEPGQYLVVARNKPRLAAIAVYQLYEGALLGPFDGQLSNSGDTLRLRDESDAIVDEVSYSARFPWPSAADALGAGADWTGIDPKSCQYRGRSLERVSFSASANDPANWLASPQGGEPSPGRANAVGRAVPAPVVNELQLWVNGEAGAPVRNGDPVEVKCRFTGVQGLTRVFIEFFVDHIEATNEPISRLAMQALDPPGNFVVHLPGQTNRAVIRYRITARRFGIDERVSPRGDDAFGWHAYFVAPVRVTANPVYDVFISSNNVRRLTTNISANPRRVTAPDPPGNPRTSWNATVPAVFVADGIVHDVQMRYHGSRYRRDPSRRSYKVHFPRYLPFADRTSVFITDKDPFTVAGHTLFRAAGFPTSRVRWVDFFLNNTAPMVRLEQEEYDQDMLDRYAREQAQLTPFLHPTEPGTMFKCVGSLDGAAEGPYGRGDGSLLPQRSIWTPLDRYHWTYSLQNHEWLGHAGFKEMIESLAAARRAATTNLQVLREYLDRTWDVDHTLTYLAVINWMNPWDDTTHNYFLWQKRNGKWCLLPWDFDNLFGTSGSGSIFTVGNFGSTVNAFKDAFLKAYRNEFRERMFLLNNTLFQTNNLSALGLSNILSFARTRVSSVNTQCALGVFQRPQVPANIFPHHGAPVEAETLLRASEYVHSSNGWHRATQWQIRSATDDYHRPVYSLTSSNHLTTLPLPFFALTNGGTYYWKCVYYDQDLHPSLASPESSFTYAGDSPWVELISWNSSWRYWNETSAPETGWTLADFDESRWREGRGIFAGGGPILSQPIGTLLPTTRSTYYFRRTFAVPWAALSAARIRFRCLIDDGAVFYLNGAELKRVGMPPTVVERGTLSQRTVGVSDYEGPFEFNLTNLTAGTNVLAVELHQSTNTGGDNLFGAVLEIVLPPATDAQSDRDADGLPDRWEWDAGLDPFLASDAQWDRDADGLNTREEFRSGTDPRDGRSTLAISGVQVERVDGGIKLSLTFESVPGRKYVLQQRQTLDAAVWSEVAQFTAGPTEHRISWSSESVPEDRLPGSLFFRISVRPP